jgi:hypothetical protein
MSKRVIIRGEKHHWWPEVVSSFWKNSNGKISMINPNGLVVSTHGKSVAKLSNGHNLIFDKPSSWDSTFEQLFDNPDGKFKKVIFNLKSIATDHLSKENSIHSVIGWNEERGKVDLLLESLLSLVMRSPGYRAKLARTLTAIRGSIESSELKQLVSTNLRQNYNNLQRIVKGQGRFAVLISESIEFIYGDGTYTNITSHSSYSSELMFFIPVTPNVAVFWYCPISHQTEPRIVSYILNDEEVKMCNESTQIYSKDYLFFCDQTPKLSESFKANEFLIFTEKTNPMCNLITRIINESDESYRFALLN